jgi:pyruvate,water dikinase
VKENFTIWFHEIGEMSVDRVGGKSAKLAEMRHAGLPVPNGFAITTDAYNRFLQETGTAARINRYMESMAPGRNDISDLQNESRVIRGIIEIQTLPSAMRRHIVSCYEELCRTTGVENVPVAVRSSGLSEDLKDSSFAGQYDSFLNVRGPEDLLKKIVECWSSQFTTRAITYRRKMNIPAEGSSMGVAVLKMIHARSAGVGFSVHPLTGDPSKVVLEGSWGLGESIVQGLVAPDRFVIEKGSMTLIKRSISHKEKLLDYGPSGIEEKSVSAEKRNVACLSDTEAIKLAEFAVQLETHYGAPQDMEWAVDPDLSFPSNLFLVQTRPVTVVSREKNESEKADYLVDLMVQMVQQVRKSAMDSSKRRAGPGGPTE